MPGAFVSYRRDDSGPYARRIAAELERRFGEKQVFIDVDDIGVGARFGKVIDGYLEKAGACIAVIGPDWLTVTDRDGRRRLDDENDYVRREVAHALARDITVVPVLVGGAEMPHPRDLPPDLRELCEINALVADHDLAQLPALVDAITHDLAVRTPVARAGGALLYGWTSAWGLLTLIGFAFISTFSLNCGNGPEPDTPTTSLLMIVVMFVGALALVAWGRWRTRARTGPRRHLTNLLLYAVAPITAVLSWFAAQPFDPNP